MQIITHTQLMNWQSLPLETKIEMTKERINSWYEAWEGQVYVSFSGGKDSTVLLHIARECHPDIPAVFVNTGLEYPEIVQFVKSINNVTILRPKMPFHKVIEKYGYPIISKENAQKISEIRDTKSEKLRNKRLYGQDGAGKLSEKWKFMISAPFKISHLCCNIMNKKPIKKYEKDTERKSIVGTMAEDSRLRKTSYMGKGCNSFDSKRPISTPMGFWTEQDVWDYIHKYNVPYSPIYDMGYNRTGCMFCMFGVHLEKEPNRFQRMAITHPKLYKYCMDKLNLKDILKYMGIPYKQSYQLKLF